MGNRKVGILFFATIILAFFAGYQSQTFLINNEPEEYLDVYSLITGLLDEGYYYDLDQDEKDAAFLAQMQAIVESYAKDNNDPYTRLFKATSEATATSAESYVGLGITITPFDSFLKVEDVVYQGPSYTKLYPNDLIVGIKTGEALLYFKDLEAHESAITYLKGNIGEIKSLIVIQPDLEEIIVEITYEKILTPTAYAKSMDENMAYIKITQFSGYIEDEEGNTLNKGTSIVFSEVLKSLETNTLKDENDTLILDLRNNPGGSLSALTNEGTKGVIPGITQQLLVKDIEKPLFSMINKKNLVENYYGGLSIDKVKTYQIKVLVNEHSASAAEVLAAALNINGGYELYGNYTYGKSVFQITRNLESETTDLSNYYLTYTEGIWTYDGDKKVSDYPLDVNLLEQSGYNDIFRLLYQKDISFDQVSNLLVDYQKFLNIYFNLNGVDEIREDGYFDQRTKDYILMFQQEQSLNETSKLDKQTAYHMYNLLKQYQNDLTYDIQLNKLIDLIKS